MTFPITIERCDGQYAAKLVGEHDVRVVRATREEALSAIQGELRQRVERGELVSVEVARGGSSAVAGKFADDPTLQDICEEIHSQRDQDRDELPG